jgi:glycosyltransferase involved in cell wall biosynthesis
MKNTYYSCRTHWDSKYIKSKNPNAKIYMIWEMIREEFFNNSFSLKKENILFVGGKNHIKGLKELLNAYNNSLQKLGMKLIILGNCSINDIKELIRLENLKNIDLKNIDCRGMQDSKGMIKAYKESYCLVHPTYIDNSPNSICEAQLSGLPVIATDVGGVSSLIKNKETGLLIDKSIESIEKVVEFLFNNDDIRDVISNNSRTVARKRHNNFDILEQTVKMYQEILKDGAKNAI